MHRRLDPPAALRLALCLGFLSGLAACAPGKDQFAPACPQASLLPQAGDLTRYRANSSGHDLTDLALRGRVVKVDGKCEAGPNAHTLDATVKVLMQLDRGPALTNRTADVSYFVAVARGDQILDKHVYTNRVVFPSNLDQVWLESDPIFMRLPVSGDTSGAAYTVWVGFQLTPQEMAGGQQARATAGR